MNKNIQIYFAKYPIKTATINDIRLGMVIPAVLQRSDSQQNTWVFPLSVKQKQILGQKHFGNLVTHWIPLIKTAVDDIPLIITNCGDIKSNTNTNYTLNWNREET